MDKIICRAASPDNKFDLLAIIELMRAVYGDTFPLASAYEPQFWQQHIGQRFTSILVYRGRQLVGHLAAQPEGSDGKMVQMLFPLCHPSALSDSDEIYGAAWKAFESQATRQSWHGIYFFAFAHVPEMVSFGERILNVQPIALCPAYFPPSNLSVKGTRPARNIRQRHASERTDIIVGQRLFNPEQERQRSIYINEQHLDLVSKLYQAVGLPRDLRTSVRPEKLAAYPLPADRSAIETRYFARSGIMHAYIEPSLLASEAELSQFQQPHSDSTFIFVKGYDPRALEVADWLENNGYEFSGILPFIHDRESLLFSHTNSESNMRATDAETVLLSGFSPF